MTHEDDIEQLAQDLADVSGCSVADARRALAEALTGEHEPLRYLELVPGTRRRWWWWRLQRLFGCGPLVEL